MTVYLRLLRVAQERNDVRVDVMAIRQCSSIARDSEILPTISANDGAGSNLDADQLDGKDSTDFKASCGAGWVFYGGTCWQSEDACCFTYAGAAARCGFQGGRLPALNDFLAVIDNGPTLSNGITSDWAAGVTADDEAVYINQGTGTNIGGVRRQSTSSWVRCVRPLAQALGTPWGPSEGVGAALVSGDGAARLLRRAPAARRQGPPRCRRCPTRGGNLGLVAPPEPIVLLAQSGGRASVAAD